MEEKNATLESVQQTANQDSLFASLMENEIFRNRFYHRLLDMANDYFSPNRIDAFIDEYEKKMTEPMKKEYLRFYEKKTIEDFINGCESIRRFFHLRNDFINKRYGNAL